MKALKLWNGGGACCKKTGDPMWDLVPLNGAPTAFVAAYSRADARRVIAEYCGNLPADSELSVYWNEGTWGAAMEGVEPERGLWLGFDRKKPLRVL
jgi:hypothetical protein